MTISALDQNEQAGTGAGLQIKTVFVVLNPVAGLTDASTARDQIAQFCESIGWECDIHETTPDDDLRKIVQDALKKGVDLVLAAGGDGTVSGVVTGMVNSKVPMAIIPAGTGNALARDLNIPLQVEGALEMLRSDYQVQVLDVMEVNKEDYYVLNVSVGISSLVMRKTAREDKRRFGMLAYLWRGIGSIINTDMHRFSAVVDGKSYRFSASEVMITNNRLLGLPLQLEGVTIDPNDGRLDMFIVRAKNTGDYLRVFSGFVLRQKQSEVKLRYLEVKDSVEIRSEFPLPVQADGEDFGVTPVTVRLVPSALRVIVPAKR